MRFADPVYGDLKFILEPSRFLFVYPLARAFALTGEERFAQCFWKFFEDWYARNPPMDGPLWICGQECSLRILAWSFALYAFLGSTASTPERVELLVSAIAAHAWRVEQTIGYARSQRSNHLLSEGVGLWTAGILFPEVSAAPQQRLSGLRLLREAAVDQITTSGVHLQYSFNYQRMVLQLLLWTLRLAELHETSLPEEVRERTASAFDLLSMFVDSESGRAPNYGSNDGTLILPLALADYCDYRPLVRMGTAVLSPKSILGESGAWDEAALWLGQSTAVVDPSGAKQRDRDLSGYYRLGNQNSWAMVRSAYYARRPFQADQLHVDLWRQGLNLAVDPGTYLYNGAPPWDNGLAGTAVHNTVMIDEREQMRRAGRFLWLNWAQAKGRLRSLAGFETPDCFEGQHDGYKSVGVIHHRTVTQIAEGAWIVEDDLTGKGEHEVRLHWLLADLPFEIESNLPLRVQCKSNRGPVSWNVFSSVDGRASVARAGKTLHGEPDRFEPVMGWQSPTYGELAPAVSLIYRVRQPMPTRLITVILAGEGFRIETGQGLVTIWQDGARIREGRLAAKKT
jgi:hypothetical protein